MTKRILIVKLGALGDFVQATGPFAAIRAHHRQDHITLLTGKTYAPLAQAAPWFDDVWIDERPKAWQIAALLRLRRTLRQGKFDRVYDLQTSDRSSSYLRLMGRVEWSGIAKGCSHPHANPNRDAMHSLDRQAEQLRMAGIASTPAPDMRFADRGDIARFGVPEPFFLMVAGGAAHRPAKRWPSAYYGCLAQELASRGLTPLLLGTPAEAAEIADIQQICPSAFSLIGQTSFFDIVSLACKARFAIGNDTGPMHMIAASACPSLVLFSAESNPALCAPRGDKVMILRRNSLTDLAPDEVKHALALLTGF